MRAVFVIFFGILVSATGCRDSAEPSSDRGLRVITSIAPQKFILDWMLADLGTVEVLVPPGHSPATYEPLPRQMAVFAQAHIYFKAGVPFEKAWAERLRASAPTLKEYDLAEGLRGKEHAHDDEEDPHIWVDPLSVVLMIDRARDALKEVAPEHAVLLDRRAKEVKKHFYVIDGWIRDQMVDLKRRAFLVYHPAWGYYAHRYQLEQISIEHHGKEPSSRVVQEVLKKAKKMGIRTVFVQKQFSSKMASVVAKELGDDAKVVIVDPLAEDILKALTQFTTQLVEALKE